MKSVPNIVCIIQKMVVFGIVGSYFITSFCYALISSRTFQEYVESSFFVSSSVMVFFWYSSFFWQSDDFARLFIDLDAIIEKRKTELDSLYRILFDHNNSNHVI